MPYALKWRVGLFFEAASEIGCKVFGCHICQLWASLNICLPSNLPRPSCRRIHFERSFTDEFSRTAPMALSRKPVGKARREPPDSLCGMAKLSFISRTLVVVRFMSRGFRMCDLTKLAHVI